MALTFNESPDKSTVTVTGEAPPYTVEQLYNQLVSANETQDARLDSVEAGSLGWHDLQNALDDAAAATAGVPLGGLYRNGSVIQVRVT